MDTADTGTLSELIEKFIKLGTLMTRYQHCLRKEQRLAVDPHRGQGRVLLLLKMRPNISQRDLGFVLGMRNQTLGELLGKLERVGYITRTPSPRDRRAMIVHLTPEGEAAANTVGAQQRALGNPFECLTGEEQAQVSAAFDKMIAGLEERLGETDTDEDWFGGLMSGIGSRAQERFAGWDPDGRMPFGFRHGGPCAPEGVCDRETPESTDSAREESPTR
ncbi:MarR family transcriptional regulator [Eubacteriales bacterium OttesenSCG-928-A19]|nr:MarR family transcriptional regulator [Eubacteriales bacterium OttesenSCG-928-A19]